MKKIIVSTIPLVLFAMCLGGIFVLSIGGNQAKADAPLAAFQQALETPAPVIKTPLPLPTFDQRQADGLATSAAANSTTAASYSTVAAAEVVAMEAAQARTTEVVAYATATADGLSAIQVRQDLAMQDRLNQIEANKKQADVEAYERNSKSDFAWSIAGAVGLFGLAVFGMRFLFRLGNAVPQPQPAAAADDDEPEAVPAAPVRLPAYPAGLDIRQIVPRLASAEQLHEIARGVVSGVPFTHDNWTPASKCLAEGKFTSLQYTLVHFGMAQWVDDQRHTLGVELTSRGEEFFAAVLSDKLQAPPPPAVSVAEMARNDGYRPIDESYPGA